MTPSAPGPVDRIDLDEIAPVATGPVDLDPAALVRLVLSCPAVVAMHGGFAGEAATYLPGRRVVGVRILADSVEVHVVSRWPLAARELAAQIWVRTAAAVGDRRVDVVVGDVLMPEPEARL